MNDTWYDETLINRFEQKEHLTNNQKCAVLIVGGGLAGLCLLYKLKKNNVDAVLIEENHIGSGASGRNGGFCLSGWAQDYDVLLKYLSGRGAYIGTDRSFWCRMDEKKVSFRGI